MVGGSAQAHNVRRWAALIIASGLTLLAVPSFATQASAATISVANLNDSGPGSLRDAIAKAAVNDTIAVPAGKITLTSGPLAFAKNLTIAGAGSGATTISGNDASRVFTITGTPQVTLSGLTIAHGKNTTGAGMTLSGEITMQDLVVSENHAGGGGEAGFGGGIEFGPGVYRLTDSSVIENTAGGGATGSGFGGGIDYSPSADAQTFALTLTRSQVDGNRAGGGATEASGFGGGIEASSGFNNGAITISLNESSVSSNVAGGDGEEASGFGGGLSLGSGGEKNALSLTIEHSAITGNVAGGAGVEASGFGGGIEYSSGGTGVTQVLNASNSTISANSAGGGGKEADGFGGGLSFGSGTGALSHVTIANNSAGGGGGTAAGGGVEGLPTGGIDDSIIAANSGGDCEAAVTSNGNNIDSDTTCGFKGPGDKAGVDAKLGPVADHGGPTLTQMPLAGSPAIDAGNPVSCPASDQREVSRPQGAGCDIGAVEVPPPLATTSAVASVTSSSASVAASVTPNFSATSYRFDYGTTTGYGSTTAATSAGEGGVGQSVSATLAALKPGTAYHFRVVATNAAGTAFGADEVLSTAKAPPIVTVNKPKPRKASPALRVTGARITNRRFRVGKSATAISARRTPVGTSFRFRLSAPARVQIAFTRTAPGLRRGRSCLAPSRKLRQAHAKRCTRTLTVGKLIRTVSRAGASSIAFSGRIGTRPLTPRSYRAVLTASGSGRRSTPIVLSFTVVR